MLTLNMSLSALNLIVVIKLSSVIAYLLTAIIHFTVTALLLNYFFLFGLLACREFRLYVVLLGARFKIVIRQEILHCLL